MNGETTDEIGRRVAAVPPNQGQPIRRRTTTLVRPGLPAWHLVALTFGGAVAWFSTVVTAVLICGAVH